MTEKPAPRMPTRADYIAMGIDPAVLDAPRPTFDLSAFLVGEKARIREERAAAAGPVSRVLNMSERAEEAAMRFMDEGQPRVFWMPSTMWVIAWCAIGTSHGPLLRFAEPSHYRTDLAPPCTMQAILEYAALPSASAEEAEHRADRFCGRALDRARQLYRDGFYANPFAIDPERRPCQ